MVIEATVAHFHRDKKIALGQTLQCTDEMGKFLLSTGRWILLDGVNRSPEEQKIFDDIEKENEAKGSKKK